MGFFQKLFGKSDKKDQPAGQVNIPPEFGDKPTDSMRPQPPVDSGQSSASSPIDPSPTPAVPPEPDNQPPTPGVTPPSASPDTFAPEPPELPGVPKPADEPAVGGGDLPEVPKADDSVPGSPELETPVIPEVPGAEPKLPEPPAATSPEIPPSTPEDPSSKQ